MSIPRSLTLAKEIKVTTTETPRGDFATFTCEPQDSALPRGHVLLVPGFTGSKEDFSALLPLLANARWSAASYDQRGQFETVASATDDFSLEGLAADAVTLSTTIFGADERVHLVGHSFGGLVAARAAIDHPDMWASLTLMCSGPGSLSEPRREEMLEAARIVSQDGLEAAYNAQADHDATLERHVVDPDTQGFLHHRFLSNSPQALAKMAGHLASAVDRTAELAELEVPVAVLRGADDDAWPHTVQDDLADALGTTVVVIANAAHSPAVEQPEATRDALARIWLR